MSNAVFRAVVCLAAALWVQVASAQSIERYAGDPTPLNAPAASTPVNPVDVAISPDGSVWTDGQDQLLRFDPATGTVSEPWTDLAGWNSGIFDAAGNLYFILQSSVYRLDVSSGATIRVVGNGTSGDSGDGGPAASAALNYPRHLAFDIAGNLYIADAGANRVRIVGTDGIIRPFAGMSFLGGSSSGDGGPALYAGFNGPNSVAIDAAGDVFISENWGGRIRKVAADTGVITTFAGTGEWGFNGDGIPALAANITLPSKIAFDGAGNLLVNEQGSNRIRRISADGLINTMAGTGSYSPSGDGGPAPLAGLGFVEGFALDAYDNLYIGDLGGMRLRRVAQDTGVITSVLGNGTQYFCGDVAHRLDVCLLYPTGLAFDPNGNLLIVDSGNARVRKVDRISGMTATVAGNGQTYTHSGDGGPAIEAGFGSLPERIVTDAAGNFFVSSVNDHRVRRVDVSTGIITTIAGNGSSGFSGDWGPASAAQLNRPYDLAFDAAGNLLIADSGNHRIRRIDAATGIITTIAGNGLTTGPLGDNGPPLQASLKGPTALAFDAAGNLLISDREHFRLRKIDAATGVITTIAGNGTVTASGDGGPALAAGINAPEAIALDAAGNIFFSASRAIRKIDVMSGVISPVGSFDYARALRFDDQGTLYVAETSAKRVVRLPGIGAARDTTPPVITPHIVGTLGSNNWYVSDVQVSWTVTDPESTISSKEECGPISLTQDTVAFSRQCTATSAGGTSSYEILIKRDATAPTVTFGAALPAAGASGWHNTDVSIPYTVGDVMSGPSEWHGPNPILITAEGANQSYEITVSDAAGNWATFDTPPVNIDRTPPVITAVIRNSTLGGNGWYRGDVTILDFTVNEMPESILSMSEGCDGAGIDEDTPGVTFTCSVTSGGGSASRSVTIKRDNTPPVLTFGAFSPVPNTAGWNKTNVSVPFTRSDALSGLASTSATSPLTLNSEGAGVTGQVTVTDLAGNVATYTTPPRNIDKTAPLVNIGSPANGATYGFYHDVGASYTCDDVSPTSCTGPVASGSQFNTTSPGTRTFKVTAQDSVGLTKSVTHSYFVESQFHFDGFLPPMEAVPNLNLVARGALVPIRWQLPTPRGGFVTNPASFVSATVSSLSCGSVPAIPLSDTASGPAGLAYDFDTGIFTYNWQTNAGWTGCRKLIIKLKDSSTHEVRFKFQ